MFILGGIVTDTVEAFVNALLEFLGQAWDIMLETAELVACPVLTDLIGLIPETQVQGAWDAVAPCIYALDWIFPVSELSVLVTAYWVWVIGFIVIRTALKIAPTIW